MKLSSETLSVLKNFGAINQGIYFKKGKTLKTVSSHKNILAEVTIQEDIPKDFGIYDLNNFLSVVSLYKDDPSFEFEDKQMMIVGNKGRLKLEYRFCDVNTIVTPPEKSFQMPEAEVNFVLTAEDFECVLRAASVLSSPHIAVESDGKKIYIVTLDLQNDAANKQALEIADGNGDVFKMVFKAENISKVLQGSYDVTISSKGVSHFKNKNVPLQYYISTESGSKYERKS